MKTDPAPDAKCRDKFLVQSAPITSDKEFASIATVVSYILALTRAHTLIYPARRHR